MASAVAGVLLAGALAADAKVLVTVSTGDAYLSLDTEPNCRTLNALPDDQLPKNVVRLHATVTNADPAGVRYEWSLPDPLVGVLAADLPLDPNDTTFSLRSMASEYGNRCLVTKEQLPFYNQPTILWIAPTCETALPEETKEQFKGGLVTFRVKASLKKRSLGKAAVRVGVGRLGGITMFVNHDDGIGDADGIPTSLGPFLSARLDPLVGRPTVDSINIDDGQGEEAAVEQGFGGTPCTGPDRPDTYDACARQVLYEAAGKFRVVATAELVDGSVLCDANTLVVQSSDNRAKLEVQATPRLGTYVPGDKRKGTVALKVTLTDQSIPPRGGLFFDTRPPLTTATEITLGKLKDSRSRTYDFRRCSGTKEFGCNADADCPSGQFCMVRPHCSTTVQKSCETNFDCTCDKVCPLRLEPCPEECVDESCVFVLNVASIGSMGPGQKVVLFEDTVDLLNLFPSDAEIEDTWTVTPFNAAPASATVKYRIKKPKNRAARQRR